MAVKIKLHNNYATILIDSPKSLNALGTKIACELWSALQSKELDAAHGIILKTHSVDTKKRRIAIAGGDLKELAQLDRHGAHEYCEKMTSVCDHLATNPRPTVFFADGDLIGGGAELALACDVRFATESTQLHFKQLSIGLTLGYGSSLRLMNLIGKGKAQSLLYLDQVLTADEARSMGIFHRLFSSPESFEKQEGQLMEGLLAYGDDAWSTQKKMFNLSDSESIRSQEKNLFTSIWKNPVHHAQLKKFLSRSSKK